MNVAVITLDQMIHVRHSTAAEAQIVQEVVAAAFATLRTIYRPNQDAISTLDRDAYNSQQLLALDGDVAVGTVNLTIKEGAMVVSQLAVLPIYRRQSIATQLLNHAERIACDSGHTTLSLNTIMETGNVEIFERLGFRKTRQHAADWCISPDGNKLTDVGMDRPLKPRLKGQTRDIT